jgi:transcriptional regulator with XRE-family HTH domain
MDIGKKVRHLRKSRGMKQEFLAEKLNISINAISQYETGKRNIDLTTMKKLAEIFDVPIDYFIDENIELDDTSIEDKDQKSDSQQSLNYTIALLKGLIDQGSITSLDDIKDEHLEALITMLKKDADILLKEKGSN